MFRPNQYLIKLLQKINFLKVVHQEEMEVWDPEEEDPEQTCTGFE